MINKVEPGHLRVGASCRIPKSPDIDWGMWSADKVGSHRFNVGSICESRTDGENCDPCGLFV